MEYEIKIDTLTDNGEPVFTDSMTLVEAEKQVPLICKLFGVDKNRVSIIQLKSQWGE
jgi:hypothetical protein